MLFPISDDDRKLAGPAYVTLIVIVANLAVFFLLQQAGGNRDFTYGWSVIPYEVTTGEDLTEPQRLIVDGRPIDIPQAPGPPLIYLTVLTAMFMHGGFAHLFGNMLYLWIFGDNVEHRFGAVPFLAFYLASGIAGTVAQIAVDPQSVVPNLGASGAISGVLGAYMILFPRNRVIAIFFYHIVSVPAVVAIGMWVAFQFFAGLGSIMVSQESVGGVAYAAHLGGFASGVVLALVLRVLIRDERKTIHVRDDRSRRGLW